MPDNSIAIDLKHDLDDRTGLDLKLDTAGYKKLTVDHKFSDSVNLTVSGDSKGVAAATVTVKF